MTRDESTVNNHGIMDYFKYLRYKMIILDVNRITLKVYNLDVHLIRIAI